jgi:hypothetical protein
MGPFRISLFAILANLLPSISRGEATYADLDAPAHAYWTRPLEDAFTKLKAELESGKIPLTSGDEMGFVVNLLGALEIPVSSQTLVFSNTSLQLRLISPRNPRAIYFNEDIYLGWVPGGQIEVASLDPALGGIYYIADIPRDGRAPLFDRANRCMNCHAEKATREVPGLVIKSVLPGTRGGSIDSFRRDETGHSIPLEDRFGGWHLTGKHHIKKHWGNAIGDYANGTEKTIPVEPGQYFDLARYPVPTSDILAHLLHEHQVGFVNRVVEGTYKARAWLAEDGATLTAEHAKALDEQAGLITRYVLFADEAKLPPPGVTPDPVYASAFLENRRKNEAGLSLKDLDLRDHIFRHRCSYMVYSSVFTGMPETLKSRVLAHMKRALGSNGYPHLPLNEKQAIRSILTATLPGPEGGW